MIITDKGIIIEDNKHRSITGGVMTVGHDRIEQAVMSAKSVMYQANSERAVQCLLRSSARYKICYPAVCRSDSKISKGASTIEDIEYSDKTEISCMNDSQKILSLLINRVVIGYGHCINYGRIFESILHSGSKQLIFITLGKNGETPYAMTCNVDRTDVISCTTLAELSDVLWMHGCFITRVRVSDSGTEFEYARVNWNKNGARGEVIKAIKKYTAPEYK